MRFEWGPPFRFDRRSLNVAYTPYDRVFGSMQPICGLYPLQEGAYATYPSYKRARHPVPLPLPPRLPSLYAGRTPPSHESLCAA